MNRICIIFGHKWDTSKPVSRKQSQNCLRKDCLSERVLMWNKYPRIGEASVDWEIIDWDKILK